MGVQFFNGAFAGIALLWALEAAGKGKAWHSLWFGLVFAVQVSFGLAAWLRSRDPLITPASERIVLWLRTFAEGLSESRPQTSALLCEAADRIESQAARIDALEGAMNPQDVCDAAAHLRDQEAL